MHYNILNSKINKKKPCPTVYVPTPYEVIKKVPYPVHVAAPYPVVHEKKVAVEVRIF